MSRNLKSELTFNFANASVAMIDASPICLEVLTGILSGCGFRKMFRSTDLRSGGDIIKTHTLDLILLDPYGYGDEGYDLVRWLRAEKRTPNATAPIVIVTAYTRVRLISAARQCGADYVIAKPFSTTGLIERVLWVAESEGRRGELLAPSELVSNAGSGVEMW